MTDAYMDVLCERVMPQLETLEPSVILQKNIVPPHWKSTFATFQRQNLVIGGLKRMVQLHGPETSHLLFFSMGICKGYRFMGVKCAEHQ